MLAMLLMMAAAPVGAPAVVSAPVNPNANLLFDRDPVLKSWALRRFDSNHDGWLTLYEAQPALRAFQEVADADGDGRVTIHEYRYAKEFILARYRPN